jgi:DNA repair protein RecO (recombination protein O)
MTIEKTPAIVLSVTPFRETSFIAALLTRTQGRTGAVAKGIRRSPQRGLTLERGLLVEMVLYFKPNRDLHTAGQISVVNYFPSIRNDLGKLALRDAAFELILKSVTVPETNTELFDFACEFLERLEAADPAAIPLHELWRFYVGWASHLGFMLNLQECIRCGRAALVAEGGVLAIERGGFLCGACGGSATAPAFVPGKILSFLSNPSPGYEYRADGVPAAAGMRLTRLLADYCRFHLEIRTELKALSFLESVFFNGVPAVTATPRPDEPRLRP